jgi:23S rRNA (uridine2552-2'-O)-methyltransferase
LSRWKHERANDYYYKKARETGYRSRAAYKLQQINSKFNIFEEAENVLDLGAAPGGWLQVAAEFVGEDDLVVGVDLLEIPPFEALSIITIVGDVTDPSVQEEVIELFEGKADVILSDMAPNVIGEWSLDEFRQIELARTALRLTDRLLKHDGWFVVKIFQGSEHIKFIREVKAMFSYVKNFKPKASRKGSAERYIVARNLRRDRRLPSPSYTYEGEEGDERPIPGDQLFQDPE